jgi:hypothetical protein
MIVSDRHELEIEKILRERTGRECIFVPSGRMGIYLALVTWLSPGDHVLMSPVDDDVVLFTVLAAGMRPVMAPLSPYDGNIDPDAVPESMWASVRAVLTTNLYGLPDRLPELRMRCNELGIALIEDAAHALYTDVAGTPVGAFGEVSVFSFSKHLAGAGGAIALVDPTRRGDVLRVRDRLVSKRPLRVRISDALRPHALTALERLRLRAHLRAMRRAVGAEERRAHRMPLRPKRLRSGVAAAPAVDPFDRWLRVDKHDYRLAPREECLARTVERLRLAAQDQEARIDGVTRLRQLAATAPAAQAAQPQALFRVPLLVEDRDAAGAALDVAGHQLHYVYDPPLDDYAGSDFVDPSPAPECARWWARHVLPVDPLLADRALPALEAASAAVTPAGPLGGAPTGVRVPP